MRDPKQLALELLEIEKLVLMEEKDEYSVAVVVIVTPEGRYWEEVTFNNEEEMTAAYAHVVERAKEQNAVAIVTINTSRQKSLADNEDLDHYWWGKLASEGCGRALTLTVTGPDMGACCLSMPYRVENNEVVFEEIKDFEPAQVNLLPNWP